MPAPNLGLVGARGVGAMQAEIQKMVAERRAQEELEYKRRTETEDRAELARHRRALERPDQHFGWVQQADGSEVYQELTPGTTAARKPTQPQMGWVRQPDGSERYEELKPGTLQASKPTTPENLTGLEGHLKRVNAQRVKAGGREMTPDEELAESQKYTKATTRESPPMGSQVAVQVQHPDGTVTWELRSNAIGANAPDPAEQRNRLASSKRAQVVFDSIAALSERINTGQGAMAKITGAVARAEAEANLNDDVSEYQAMVSGFTPLLARAVGHTGVLTEQDVASVKAMLPAPGDSKNVRDRKIARINTIMAGMNDKTAAGAVPPEVAAMLKDEPPGQYTLSDGSVWIKTAAGIKKGGD